jgi:hypothetical protein
MQDRLRIAKHDVPGQGTGRSQGHLSSYVGIPLGRSTRAEARARCKADRTTPYNRQGGVLETRQTQKLRGKGLDTHTPSPGNPRQAGTATTNRAQQVGKDTDKYRAVLDAPPCRHQRRNQAIRIAGTLPKDMSSTVLGLFDL